MPALCVKAQKPVMGLLNGVLTSTASATRSSSCYRISIVVHLISHSSTYLLEFVQLVLLGDVVPVGHYHARHESVRVSE